MALPAGRYGVTKNQLLKIKKLPMNTIKLIEELTEKFDLLGSAAFKDSVSVVTESSDLIESGAVYSALQGKTNNTVITNNIETGTTYSRAYSVGEHFMNNGVFRTVKATVASGDEITDNNSFVDTVDNNFIKSATVTGTTNQNGNLDIYEGTDRIILQAYCQFGVGNIASLFRSGTNVYRVRIVDGQGNPIANSQREITYYYI